jgi:hypothetical protein
MGRFPLEEIEEDVEVLTWSLTYLEDASHFSWLILMEIYTCGIATHILLLV